MGAGLMLMSLLLAAAPAPAGDPLIALVKDVDGRQCLPDGSLCLTVPVGEEGAGSAALVVASPAVDDVATLDLPVLPDGSTAELWPNLIALGGGGDRRYLAGILARQNAMYSGGGGSAARLHLYELDAEPGSTGLGAELLDVVWDGSLMIRACFSEEDMRDRLEACHDQYDFAATLSGASGEDATWPTLTYRGVATTFPRTSRRSEDNSAVKLKPADLVRAEDPVCTYARTLRYNAATGRYEMDRPAPDCSDYTTP
jgi:hypothetical protein